ncbi:hypothetical protein GOODEAATRI_021219, partial [Goodea atripinnis]
SLVTIGTVVSVYISAKFVLWFFRIRITRQLEVEAEEVSASPEWSESEPESQVKSVPRRKSKRNRKDQSASLAEQLENKGKDYHLLYFCNLFSQFFHEGNNPIGNRNITKENPRKRSYQLAICTVLIRSSHSRNRHQNGTATPSCQLITWFFRQADMTNQRKGFLIK